MVTDITEEYFRRNGVLPLFDLLRYEIFPTESSQKLKALCVRFAQIPINHPTILAPLVRALRSKKWDAVNAVSEMSELKQYGGASLPKFKHDIGEIFELYFSIENRQCAFILLAYILSPEFQTRNHDYWSWFVGIFTDLKEDGKIAFVKGLGPVEIPIL